MIPVTKAYLFNKDKYQADVDSNYNTAGFSINTYGQYLADLMEHAS